MGRTVAARSGTCVTECAPHRQAEPPSGRLLIVVNDPAFFLSHRLPIALAARDAGWEVHVATADGPAREVVIDAGLMHHVLPISRQGLRPDRELRTLASLVLLFRRLRPDVVHLVTIKPVLYGGIGARLARVPGVLYAVSGMGSVFVGRGRRTALLRTMARWLYRRALGHRNARVLVQNGHDRDSLEQMGAVRDATLIPGSGVDLSEFRPQPEGDGPPLVLLPARMLAEKGVEEFVEAARLLRRRGVSARFQLAGGLDPGNPSAIPESRLRDWHASGHVEWLGHCEDMPRLLADCHIVCLPSYYGEGMPKSLLEAAAAGRAVVTTDHPGCRDAVLPGESAVLVPPRDAVALADALEALVNDPERRLRMGQAGRRLAEERFSLTAVVDAHLALYRQVLRGP